MTEKRNYRNNVYYTKMTHIKINEKQVSVDDFSHNCKQKPTQSW